MPLEAGPTPYADRSTARLAAARFLAKFHSIALEYPNHSPRPGVPARREWGEARQKLRKRFSVLALTLTQNKQ